MNTKKHEKKKKRTLKKSRLKYNTSIHAYSQEGLSDKDQAKKQCNKYYIHSTL